MNVINLKRILANSGGMATLKINGTSVPVSVHAIRADYTSPDKVTEIFCLVDPKAVCTYSGQLLPDIKNVIFNNPATIVIWADDVKTVVKIQNGEEFDPEKGLAMAIAKRALGNTGSYFEQFKKWCPKPEESNPEINFSSDSVYIEAWKKAIKDLKNAMNHNRIN